MSAFPGFHSPRISKRQFRHIVTYLLAQLWTAANIQMWEICVCEYFMVHDLVVILILVASGSATDSPITCMVKVTSVRGPSVFLWCTLPAPLKYVWHDMQNIAHQSVELWHGALSIDVN